MAHNYNAGYAIVDSDPNTITELISGHKIKIVISKDGEQVWRYVASNNPSTRWVKLPLNTSSITNAQGSGKIIATHSDGEGNSTNIKETITNLSFNNDILTYLKENGSRNNIDLSKYVNLITPQIKVSWGKTHDDLTGEPFTKIVDKFGKPELKFLVYKLIVDVPGIDLIKQYKPVLLVDRYRRKGFVRNYRMSNETGTYIASRYDRKSGYKHENPEQAKQKGRNNEIPLDLSRERNIIDIGAETYFKSGYPGFSPRPIGISGNYYWGNTKGPENTTTGAYIYIGLRLRLTIDGKDVETNILQHLRMNCYHGRNGNIITYNYA